MTRTTQLQPLTQGRSQESGPPVAGHESMAVQLGFVALSTLRAAPAVAAQQLDSKLFSAPGAGPRTLEGYFSYCS